MHSDAAVPRLVGTSLPTSLLLAARRTMYRLVLQALGEPAPLAVQNTNTPDYASRPISASSGRLGRLQAQGAGENAL